MRQMKKIISIILVLVLLIPAKDVYAQDVRLEDDFYTAINKEWLDTAQIKPGYTQASTFTELADKAREDIEVIFKQLIEKSYRNKISHTEQMMVTLYENYLNTKARNKEGIAPIEKYLEPIRKTYDIESLTQLLSQEEMSFFNGLYHFDISPDMENSNENTLVITSTSLQLKDPDYYTSPTELSRTMKDATVSYLEQLLELVGYDKAEAVEKINHVFLLEGKVAESMLGTKAITTHTNIYEVINNAYTLEEIEEVAPNLHLTKVMHALGYDKANKIILQEPEWLEALNSLYTEDNLELFKDYMEVMIVKTAAKYVGEDFVAAKKKYMSTLYGVVGEIPIEDEAFELVNQAFESEVGKLYVEKHFTEEAKKDVEDMVQKIILGYKKRIEKLGWMSETTKQNAILKLDHMKIKIGYPAEWEDYEGLEIKSYADGSNLFENIIEIEKFMRKKECDSLLEPVDKEEFLMSPQTVNACYSASSNDITFPAAILQPPFYDPDRADEANMGAIGMVIAHEITHAFDTSGARFDKDGNLKNWWTKADYKKFKEKSQRVRDFYSKIEVLPGQYVNGDLTVGENIADIGAMACMLDILSEKENANYKAFFESWGTVWRTVTTKAFEEQLLAVDPHAPGKARVNVVLMQFEPFYKTYHIEPGDKMYLAKEERLEVW